MHETQCACAYTCPYIYMHFLDAQLYLSGRISFLHPIVELCCLPRASEAHHVGCLCHKRAPRSRAQLRGQVDEGVPVVRRLHSRPRRSRWRVFAGRRAINHSLSNNIWYIEELLGRCKFKAEAIYTCNAKLH